MLLRRLPRSVSAALSAYRAAGLDPDRGIPPPEPSMNPFEQIKDSPVWDAYLELCGYFVLAEDYRRNRILSFLGEGWARWVILKKWPFWMLRDALSRRKKAL